MNFIIIGIILFCAIFIGSIAASLLNKIFPKIASGYLLVLVLGLFINLAFLFDYLRLDFNLSVLLLFLTLGFILLVIFRKTGKELFRSIRSDLKNILFLSFAWFVGSMATLLPILLIFPQGTLVTGNEIVNDTVVHTLFAKGFNFTDNSGLINDSYKIYQIYPRALHSTVYFISNLTQTDTRLALTITSLLTYSLTVVVIFSLVPKKYKLTSRSLVAILSVTPFLPILSTYLGFTPQIACIPFLILSLIFIAKIKKDEDFIQNIFIIAFLFLTVFNIYSIFAISVLVFAIVLKFLINLKDFKQNLKFINFKKFIERKNLLLMILIIILFAPTLVLIWENFKLFLQGPSFFLTRSGNLSEYLSPFHLTGTWLHDLGYRQFPLALSALLLFVLAAVQIIIVSRNQMKLPISRFVFYIMILLLIISVLIFNNRYVEFKYLTFFLPIYAYFIGISTLEIFSAQYKHKLINKLAVLIMDLLIIIFILINTVIPLRYYRMVPTLQYSGRLEDTAKLQENFLSKGRSLIITSDDWIHYYKDKDDFAPYTQYFDYVAAGYLSADYEFLIIDKTDTKNAELFTYVLSRRADLMSSFNNSQTNPDCIETKERFVIFILNCS